MTVSKSKNSKAMTNRKKSFVCSKLHIDSHFLFPIIFIIIAFPVWPLYFAVLIGYSFFACQESCSEKLKPQQKRPKKGK